MQFSIASFLGLLSWAYRKDGCGHKGKKVGVGAPDIMELVAQGIRVRKRRRQQRSQSSKHFECGREIPIVHILGITTYTTRGFISAD